MLNGKKVIALCTPTIADESCHQFIISLNRSLPSDDYRLLVFATSTNLYWHTPDQLGESAIFDLINYSTTDVIIVFQEKLKSPETVDRIITQARNNNVPCIVVGEPHDGAVSADFSYETGFAGMVEHVLDVHKAKRPHFIAGFKDNEFSEARKRVFMRMCRERGIYADENSVSYGDFWTNPTVAAVKKLLERETLPDAIICANDTMAIAATNTLTSAGVRVPDDIIVTGFDGINDIKFSVPRITSCVCSYEKMAQKVAEIAEKLLDKEPVEQRYLITPTPILAESCGCCRELPINAAKTICDLNDRFSRFRNEEHQMYEMSSQILTCTTIEDVARVMDMNNFYDMNCVLKNECIDETVDPFSGSFTDGYGDTAVEFYETDTHTIHEPRLFSTRNYIPEISEILTNHRTPIIFCGLNMRDIPLGYCCFHFHNDEIANYTKVAQIVNALNNAIGGFRNMRYQQYLTRQIEEMYRLDALTSLYNRGGFINEYRRRIAQDPDCTQIMTVILTDLDGLKIINDNFGHDEGDYAIKTAAEAIRKCCPKDTLCVRFGGDEMLAVYFGRLDQDKLREDFERFFDERNAVSGKPYRVSSSIGIYECSGKNEIDFDELIRKSDKLMYFDKARKKGKVLK